VRQAVLELALGNAGADATVTDLHPLFDLLAERVDQLAPLNRGEFEPATVALHREGSSQSGELIPTLLQICLNLLIRERIYGHRSLEWQPRVQSLVVRGAAADD
jgi:hypothetical protein